MKLNNSNSILLVSACLFKERVNLCDSSYISPQHVKRDPRKQICSITIFNIHQCHKKYVSPLLDAAKSSMLGC